MNIQTHHRPLVRAATKCAHTSLLALCALPLAAQQLDIKPAPAPDPVKGWHDMSPLSPEEIAARRAGPRRAPHAVPNANAPTTHSPLPDAVLFDRCGDGRLWSRAPSYKASFGPDGFVYVPFLGADAPRNFPVAFVLQAVRVGGHPLALPDAVPVQDGQRVTFQRGAVREVYDLRTDAIEQTFVVDSTLTGDVDIELAVVTELTEDAATPGIQFGNSLGYVRYGNAHVVDGAQLRPVATTFDGNRIRIHVPAAWRGAGPLVVDPIIQTGAYTYAATGDTSSPDIAYDATWDRFLVVWQHPFSATDMDVWSELWSGDGFVIPGTLATIDFTTFSCQNPRVASLNLYDRFLVVMQRFENNTWTIQARMRPADSVPHPTTFQVNDPVNSGPCVNPDIGGDSGAGDHWFVVWERQYAANDFDIHGRLVRGDILVEPSTLYIENAANTIYSLPSVSQSNGSGFTGTPRWMVVYQFRFSATDEDIYGAAVSPAGVITTANTAVDTSSLTDLYPSVSSPNTDFVGAPLFLATYERQSPLESRARLLSGGFVNQIPPINMTVSFGFGPYWVRAESDGNRFAVITGSSGISIGTLAYTGTALVVHESPVALPAAPAFPRLCSKRSGGGVRTDYGIAYVDTNWFPDRIITAMYRGNAPGADVTRRVMGCNGLGIDVAGRPFLGEGVTFSLQNVGFDIPGFAFGAPVPANTFFCTQCPLGVNLNGVIVLVGPTLSIPIPSNASLIGAGAAVQGFGLGSGPCALQLRFSDTIDFTIG